jgi:HEAT repeat protein
MIASMLAALLLAPPVGAAPAAPQAAVCLELSTVELERRVDAYLQAIDVAIDPEQWRALGPKAAPLLEQIASDPVALPTRRAQALWGLVHVAGPQASTVLGQLASREDQPFVVRHAAVRGLGQVASPEQLEGALRPIQQNALDARLRAAAAEELVRRSGGPSAGRSP